MSIKKEMPHIMDISFFEKNNKVFSLFSDEVNKKEIRNLNRKGGCQPH
jgi:hypothetical protein